MSINMRSYQKIKLGELIAKVDDIIPLSKYVEGYCT